MRNTRSSVRKNLHKLVLLLLIVLLTHVATTEVWMIVNTFTDSPVGCDTYGLPYDLGAIPAVNQWANWYCNSYN